MHSASVYSLLYLFAFCLSSSKTPHAQSPLPVANMNLSIASLFFLLLKFSRLILNTLKTCKYYGIFV